MPAACCASARTAPARSRVPPATATRRHASRVTDANVVLGIIDPDYFLGGRIKLDSRAKAEAAVGKIARNWAQPRSEARLRDLHHHQPQHGRPRSRTSPSTKASIRATAMSSAAAAPPPATSATWRASSASKLRSGPSLRCPASAPMAGFVSGVLAPGRDRRTLSTTDQHFRPFMASTSAAFLAEEARCGVPKALRRPCARRAAASSSPSRVAISTSLGTSRCRSTWPGSKLGAEVRACRLAHEAFHDQHERIYTIKDEADTVEFTTWKVRAIHGDTTAASFRRGTRSSRASAQNPTRRRGKVYLERQLRDLPKSQP